jgi:hypothetical protein
MAVIRWRESDGRFVNERGQFISDAAVRSVIDNIADHASDRMAAASQALLEGRSSLAAWQASLLQDIKNAHVSTGVLAHGGVQQMNAQRWGALGPTIREQYQFLANFAAQIASGEQPLNGSLTARARQYGQASRVTYERTRGAAQQVRGYQSCRNVLHAGESCSQCRSEAARGWVPVGTLVPVGSRICRSNCRCTISFRREPASVAA